MMDDGIAVEVDDEELDISKINCCDLNWNGDWDGGLNESRC